jgi:RNA recognition motif-containing protein
LFLGGLSWNTSEQDVKEYFGQFGCVESVSIKYDAMTQMPRGFGFVTFTDACAVEAVLDYKQPHKIKDKVIDPKRAKGRPIVKKVFVGGVESTLPEQEIREYFGHFGPIEGIELPFDRMRSKRREFVFVIFETEEAANAAAAQPKQTLGGRVVDVKKATPQPIAKMQQQQHNMSMNMMSGGGRGGYPEYRGRGGPWAPRAYTPSRGQQPHDYYYASYEEDPSSYYSYDSASPPTAHSYPLPPPPTAVLDYGSYDYYDYSSAASSAAAAPAAASATSYPPPPAGGGGKIPVSRGRATHHHGQQYQPYHGHHHHGHHHHPYPPAPSRGGPQ